MGGEQGVWGWRGVSRAVRGGDPPRNVGASRLLFYCVAARRSVRLVPRRVRGFLSPLSVNPLRCSRRGTPAPPPNSRLPPTSVGAFSSGSSWAPTPTAFPGEAISSTTLCGAYLYRILRRQNISSSCGVSRARGGPPHHPRAYLLFFTVCSVKTLGNGSSLGVPRCEPESNGGSRSRPLPDGRV